MTRWIAGLIAAVGIAGAAPATAQETVPGPGAVVVTIIPGGAHVLHREQGHRRDQLWQLRPRRGRRGQLQSVHRHRRRGRRRGRRDAGSR